MSTPPHRVIIVGGGIAGLVAATELERRGRPVLMLERESDLGGRVRTRRVGDFRIDRGFQVLFTAYPVLTSYLDLGALDLRLFEPAARIARPSGTSVIGDALRQPSLLFETVLSAHIPVGDVWRLLRLRRLATRLSESACYSATYADRSTRDFLKSWGFTPQTIDRFFAPFYGGILLDRSLETSASVLMYTFGMLARGATAVPARGMGAIAEQMRTRLRFVEVRTHAAAASILVEDGRAAGVVLADGSVERGTDVLLCAEAPATATLAATAGVEIAHLPSRSLGCTTVYLAANTPLLPGRALTLNAAEHPVISHAITISDVAPEYAPPGQHLIAMTAIGESAALGDQAIERAAISELAMMRRASVTAAVRVVAIERVPYSQFAQPPGASTHRPTAATSMGGLWYGGEGLHSSSLDGAARGGQMSAAAIAASIT